MHRFRLAVNLSAFIGKLYVQPGKMDFKNNHVYQMIGSKTKTLESLVPEFSLAKGLQTDYLSHRPVLKAKSQPSEMVVIWKEGSTE